MSGCLLVAADGSPASAAALRCALDFAAATDAHEIACVCVRPPEPQWQFDCAASLAAGEVGLMTGCATFALAEPMPSAAPDVDADEVLDWCASQVQAARFLFTPICAAGDFVEVMKRTARLGDAVFLGRNSQRGMDPRPRLGFAAAQVAQGVTPPTLLCPRPYSRVSRVVVVAHPGDPWEQVRQPALWAKAFAAPLVVTQGNGPNGRTVAASWEASAPVGLEMQCLRVDDLLTELVPQLSPQDLLCVPRDSRRRWRRWWTPHAAEALPQAARCPVALFS